jgi:DNA-binding NarL/FixJ family response regulator
VVLAVAVAVAILIILVNIRKTRKRDRLTGQLLKSHAQTLPGFTSTVNQLSGKSIKLSLALYEEFQDAINAIKEQQHNSQAVIVNDKQFAADYPKIANMTNLSAQEKLVTVLYQEGFDANQISLFMGISAASVRAIKSRVKTKIS